MSHGLMDVPEWESGRRRWWLSFADESGFRGAAVVRGTNLIDAVRWSKTLGCNGGGEVMGIEIAEDTQCPFPLNTLMDEATIERLDGPQQLRAVK